MAFMAFMAFMACYLNVSTSPAGADVYIDGKLRGKAPLKNVLLQPGKYNISFSKPGYFYPIFLNYPVSKTDLVKNLNVTGSSYMVTSSSQKPEQKKEQTKDEVIEQNIKNFVPDMPSKSKITEYATYIRQEYASSDLESKAWLNVWTQEKNNFMEDFKKKLQQEKGLKGLVEYFLKSKFTSSLDDLYTEQWKKIKAAISTEIARQKIEEKIPETPGAGKQPETGKTIITDINEFWTLIKSFYSGRMYLSKKEIEGVESKYDLQGEDIQNLLTEMKTYYTGRMYLSKKELVVLGNKYGLDISGLA